MKKIFLILFCCVLFPSLLFGEIVNGAKISEEKTSDASIVNEAEISEAYIVEDKNISPEEEKILSEQEFYMLTEHAKYIRYRRHASYISRYYAEKDKVNRYIQKDAPYYAIRDSINYTTGAIWGTWALSILSGLLVGSIVASINTSK